MFVGVWECVCVWAREILERDTLDSAHSAAPNTGINGRKTHTHAHTFTQKGKECKTSRDKLSW